MNLDDAIDQVAKRMTHVEDAATLSARIAGSLPDRRRRSWWILAPALAAIGIAIIVLRTFDGGSTAVLRTEKTMRPLVASSALVATARISYGEPRLNLRRPSVEPPARADHERSLPALSELQALAVAGLPPTKPIGDDPLALAPLSIEPLSLDPVQR